jgi:4-alpha-glucanotransferase
MAPARVHEPTEIRRAGVLLHPTSLPGRHGIGDMGDEAIRFLDALASAGISVWQLLPLGPTGLGNSPYSAVSVFAGNPLLIAPERLVAQGLLVPASLDVVPGFPDDRVDDDSVRTWKERLLRHAWEDVRRGTRPEARNARDEAAAWAAAPEQAAWLDDWTFFAALRERHGGASWLAWDPPLAQREPDALAAAARALGPSREYHAFVQWIFARQWSVLLAAARERGIAILGDLPIYPAMDSAEVWVRHDLFHFGKDGLPESVAGVPPDYFSETGQLWGNPIYRWDRCAAEGFAWWISRVRAALDRCDLLRLDHFRGFASAWAVPAGAKTAIDGAWIQGPGMAFFDALRASLGGLPLIAEDLGDIDDGVEALLRDAGLPGMRVLQFGLLDRKSPHHPANHISHAVAYTGTHDNDTTRGWYDALSVGERRKVCAELGVRGRGVVNAILRVAMESPAALAVVPMQDLLDLGTEARMNTPAEPEGNWGWRMKPGAWPARRVGRLRKLLVATRRAPAARLARRGARAPS